MTVTFTIQVNRGNKMLFRTEPSEMGLEKLEETMRLFFEKFPPAEGFETILFKRSLETTVLRSRDFTKQG